MIIVSYHAATAGVSIEATDTKQRRIIRDGEPQSHLLGTCEAGLERISKHRRKMLGNPGDLVYDENPETLKYFGLGVDL